MTSQQFASTTKALKHAIVDSEKTQRAIARSTRIDETRLSRIASGQIEAKPRERKALAKLLGRPQEELFPSAAAV